MNKKFDILRTFNFIGWDGYSAKPITPTLIEEAEKLWDATHQLHDEEPEVIANCDSTITFTWLLPDSELNVTIEDHYNKKGKLMYFYKYDICIDGVQYDCELCDLNDVLDAIQNWLVPLERRV